MQRYFAESKINDDFILKESDIHHIKNVMRNKIEDQIEVVYDGKIYISAIASLEPIKLQIIKEIDEDREIDINLTIAVSLVQEQKFDLILQKLTELGISTIIPLKTDRSIVKLDDKKITKKLTRWQMICKEASEQSKRTIIPKVTDIKTLQELNDINIKNKFICSLSENTLKLNEYLKDELKDILFVIGPEGGFSQNEENYLLKNGFKPVSLGKQVLRVETAAIYIASIINYRYGG